MKKNIWIVIAVVMIFISLLITYSLSPPDQSIAGESATIANKAH